MGLLYRTMGGEHQIVVDGKGHLIGRLASVVAKKLLAGQKVAVVRCEDLNISGSLFRNKVLYFRFLKKRMNTNPKKGPIHYRSPSRILWRTIRSMIPHKTARGTAAMARLKVFEGVPQPWDTVKKMVIPMAIKNTRLKPFRKFCRLGDLSNQVGWRRNDLINRMEAKRKIKAAEYFEKVKATRKIKAEAAKAVAGEIEAINKELAVYGF